MASQNDLGFASFLATGAISAFCVVDIQSDGTINVAANGAVGIGVLQEDVPVGYYGRVKLWTAPGTVMAAVSGTAVTPGTTYSIITGGFIGPVNGTTAPAYLKALQSGVASNGIVLEFISNQI